MGFIRQNSDLKRPKSTTFRHKNILWIPKNKRMTNKSLKRPFSSVFTRTNETTLYSKKRFDKVSSKTNTFNKSDLNTNFSNKTNILTSAGRRRIINNYYSKTSNKNKNNKTSQQIISPFLPLSRNKNKNFLSKKFLETSKEIGTFTTNTINELNKINKTLKRNYSAHKEPEINHEIKKTNNLIELINIKSVDYKKIRNELNLRDSNGLLGTTNSLILINKNYL